MEIISIVIEILACVISFGIQFWTVGIFCEKKPCFSRGITLLFACGFVIITYLEIVSNLVASLIGMEVTILYFQIYYNGRLLHKIFMVMAVNILTIFVNVSMMYLLAFIIGIEPVELTRYGSAARIMYVVLCKTACILIIYIIAHLLKEEYRFQKKESLIAGILFGLYFSIAFLSIYLIGKIQLETTYQLCFILINILMLAGTILILWLLRELSIGNLQKMENAILKQQIHHQEEMMSCTEKSYQQMRFFRHDINRYLNIFDILLENGDIESLKEELKRLKGENLVPERKMYTANPMINAVINEKAVICRENNIAFQTKIALGDDSELLEYALVLSNLLDNAIEAEKKIDESRRWIYLSIQIVQESISILVKNYIEQSVLESNPKLETTKNRTVEHGMGIKSVRSIVDKFSGGMDLYEQEHQFAVHILVPIKSMSIMP